MAERQSHVPKWVCYLDLVCAGVAGGIWYLWPEAGPWPLILALAPWAIRFVLTGRASRRTAFDLPLILFVLTAGVAIWSAFDRPAAWPKFWQIAGGVILFYAFANAEPVAPIRVWLLGLMGAGVAAYFLVMHNWGTYPAKFGVLTELGQALQAPLPTLPGHRLHPNVAGGLMAMLLPFSSLATVQAYRAIRQPGQAPAVARWLALLAGLAVAGLTTFGLLMTTSRAAWIAVAAAAALLLLWGLAQWLGRVASLQSVWVYTGLVAVALIGVFALAATWPGGPVAALERLPGANTAVGRAELLRNTTTLVRDYALIGAGLGSFQMLYSTYVLLLHVGFTIHSHNLYLDVAVEQGLPALLALVWMWVLFGAVVWHAMAGGAPKEAKGTRSGSLGAIAWAIASLTAAALSLVIVLIHGLVDDVLYGSRGVLLLFVPLAFAVPFVPRRRELPRWASLILPASLLLLMLLALLGRQGVLAQVYANLGAVHQGQAELSEYSWPEWPIQDSVRLEADLSQPIAEFERALVYDPGNATANRRLGMIELARGEYEQALAHLEAAYAAEPESVTTQQLYGEALIVNGRVDEGQALWAGVNNEQRQLEARLFWYQHIGDEQRAAWIKEAAEGR